MMVPMAGTRALRIPDGYRQRLPPSWQPWVDRLPELTATYLERWELEAAGELRLSHAYVVPVQRADGRACVLKLQPTDVADAHAAERELLGLRLAGPAAVRVAEEDAANGALLLERALPGTNLEDLAVDDDDAATESLALVIGDYGRPLADAAASDLRPFEELAEAFERFDRSPHGAVARRRLEAAPETRLSVVLGVDEHGTAVPALRSARATAERVLTELLADRPERALLHGDLHHGNVLSDEERGLVVVDPWGLVGERSADVAPALHNPCPLVAASPDVDALVARRLAVYAEVLGLDGERLAAWCYVYSVIRALWSLEDGGELSSGDARVRTVAALRRRI